MCMFACCKLNALKGESVESMSIKKEPGLDEQGHGSFGRGGNTIQTKTSCDKTGHEVIEILDSDSEVITAPIVRMEGVKGKEVGMAQENSKIGSGNKKKECSSPFDPSKFTKKSGTIWTDSNVASFAMEGAFQVTKEVRVDRVEYLTDIPCVWPIPRIPTAFILDLRDDAKYLVRKETGNRVAPVTPDFLLKNKVRIMIFAIGV